VVELETVGGPRHPHGVDHAVSSSGPLEGRVRRPRSSVAG
jgi:hypothetical protein